MRFDPTAYKAEKDRQRKEIELKRWVSSIIRLQILWTVVVFDPYFKMWGLSWATQTPMMALISVSVSVAFNKTPTYAVRPRLGLMLLHHVVCLFIPNFHCYSLCLRIREGEVCYILRWCLIWRWSPIPVLTGPSILKTRALPLSQTATWPI